MGSDFSQGSVGKHILSQAAPLIAAQLVHLLYNVVDRIYLGHMGSDSLALTGVGITFPIVALIMAFTALFGTGGTPLFSMARGAKQERYAEEILGCSVFLLGVSSVVLTIVGFLFRRPILFLFGASEESFAYADAYLKIYLMGTVCAMFSTGLNGYINAQGFPKIGMLTTVLGCAANIILDPIFIFLLDMGVRGAALATIISQTISAVWVIRFLTGKRAILQIRPELVRFQPKLAADISRLGAPGFFMQGTNCLVQVTCNATLQLHGGDLYVGVMTVINSVREIATLPVSGITHGALPILGYNFGAKEYGRVRQAVRFITALTFAYTLATWLVIFSTPGLWVRIFTSDSAVLAAGPGALKIYFFGFFFMAFQFVGQTVFQSLGYAKRAIFFSLLRKAVIVFPLTLMLPLVGFGVNGVFLAEPISNAIGGLACILTMHFTVYRTLPKTGASLNTGA